MFPGFSPDAVRFLRNLKRNNRREWFQPRKEIYETKVKAPMIELVEAVNAELVKFAPAYISDPKKAIYRIYRDTRFSPDKTPYKTHIAASFRRRGLGQHSGAGLYFHISTESLGVAAGYYMPGPEELFAIRTWLTNHHQKFRKAARGPEKLMGKLHGDSLTRSPKGFDPEHPAAELVRMKQWLYWTEVDLKVVETPRLQAEIVKRFRACAPVMDLLNAAFVKSTG